MGNTLTQWRSAIGSHNNFIKFKESEALLFVLERLQFILDYYGPVIIPMFLNFPYYYMLLVLCTWKIRVLHAIKSNHKVQTVNELNGNDSSCETSSINCTFVNLSFCLLTIILLLMLWRCSP